MLIWIFCTETKQIKKVCPESDGESVKQSGTEISNLYSKGHLYKEDKQMLNMVKGCRVPHPKQLSESYIVQDNRILANVNAEKFAKK